MDNAIIALTQNIATAPPGAVARPILKMCTAITPQFYKNKTVEELKAEAYSIELLTQSIEPPVLAEMCRLAICNYPIARSKNEKVFFDINYILTFFAQAFNKYFCEDVNLDGYTYCGYDIDRSMWILNEYWEKDGERIVVREILKDEDRKEAEKESFMRIYSKAYDRKFYEDIEKRAFEKYGLFEGG